MSLALLCAAGVYPSAIRAAGESPGDYSAVEKWTGQPTPLGCQSPEVRPYARIVQICKDEIALLEERRVRLMKSTSGSRASVEAIVGSIITDNNIIETCEEKLGKPMPTTDSGGPRSFRPPPRK